MNQYHYVICGHIHQPQKRQISNSHGSIIYMNSGDWVENLTSLEYLNGEWSIYRFHEDGLINMVLKDQEEESELTNNQLFDNLLKEFNLMKG